jgi:uncharacterized membrane protein YphA (DoxX/SURF4 family)
MKLSPVPILLLRLAVGIFFLYLGYTKIQNGWLTSAEQLQKSLINLEQNVHPAPKWFIENIGKPGVEVWSRAIALGETALGVSLILGLLVRLSTFVGIIVVFIFHFTNGTLFSVSFFGNPWAILVIVSLLVLNLTRAGKKYGVDSLLGKGK